MKLSIHKICLSYLKLLFVQFLNVFIEVFAPTFVFTFNLNKLNLALKELFFYTNPGLFEIEIVEHHFIYFSNYQVNLVIF